MRNTSDDIENSAEAQGAVLSQAGLEPGRRVEGPAPSEIEGFQTGRVLSISFAHATNDVYTSFLAPLLPAFIAKLALSKTEAGLLELFKSSPSLLQPFIGHLADRVSLRYFVILAPAVTATMMSLLGVAPRYVVLALLVAVAGLSSASLHAVAPAMAGRLSGRKLGRGMGLWMVGGSLGWAVGPLVVVSAVRFLTLEGTPWLMVGGWGASLLLFLRLRDVPGRPPTPSQEISFIQGLQVMRPLLGPLVGIILARALLVAAALFFLPTFLTEEGANLWSAGVTLSLVQIAGMAGSLLAGSLSDRIGRRLVVFMFTLMAPLLMFVFLGASGWAQIPVLLGVGAGLSVQAVLMALVQESCPDNRALANGVYLSISFMSESGAAVVLGALGDLFGLRLAFAVAAVASLLGLPFVRLLPAKK
jgi:FSR family fosmidomycin resistance protein-like MFS transporter